MPERNTVTQGFQVGPEVTPGTAVVADVRLTSLNLSVTPQLGKKTENVQGWKAPLHHQLGKEWSDLKADGHVNYQELPYILGGVLEADVPTTSGSVQTWLYEVGLNEADTPTTFTLEQGDAVRAHKVAYALWKSLSLDWTKDQLKLSAAGFARAFQDGITLTATPATPTQQPGHPQETSFWLDSTSGGLGGTQLTRVLKAGCQIDDRWAPVFTADASQASFADHSEKGLGAKFKLLLEANSQGLGYLSTWRAGTTQFLRWRNRGALISGGDYYELRIDAAVKLAKLSELKDEDGVYALDTEWEVVADPTWGKALSVQNVNTLAAL